MQNKMRIVIEWFKKHGAWLLLVMLGAWTGAQLYRRKSSKVASLEQALAVQRSKAALRVLQAKQGTLEALDKKSADEVLAVNAEIAKHRQAIAEAHTGKPWSSLSDDDVRLALRAAGL